MKASIIYHSKSGYTEKMAGLIKKGMESQGLEVKTFSIDAVDEEWTEESKCVIVGTPTYYADLSADMKVFLETLGKYGVAGKLGGAFATARFVYGGGESAISTILHHMLVCGMMVYSSGGTEKPPIHLGPVAINDMEQTEAVFEDYGRRMAQQAKAVFKD